MNLLKPVEGAAIHVSELVEDPEALVRERLSAYLATLATHGAPANVLFGLRPVSRALQPTAQGPSARPQEAQAPTRAHRSHFENATRAPPGSAPPEPVSESPTR